MARISTPSVPPSLQAPYERVIEVSFVPWSGRTMAQTQRAIFYPPQVDQRPLELQRIQAAAEWLATAWRFTKFNAARTKFVAARKAEMIARVFPAQYWQPIALNSEFAEKAFLFVKTTVPQPPPPWNDPTRKQTWVYSYSRAAQYAIPAPHTGLPNPSPGWFGDVQAQRFEDRWWSQIHQRYDVGFNIAPPNTRPLFANISHTMELSSSFRSNKFWASLNIAALLTEANIPNGQFQHAYHGLIQPRWAYRLPLDAPATPWAQTISGNYLLDCRFTDSYDHTTFQRWLHLYLSPIAPHGKYFSLNDWCQCWLSASVQVYLAKPP